MNQEAGHVCRQCFLNRFQFLTRGVQDSVISILNNFAMFDVINEIARICQEEKGQLNLTLFNLVIAPNPLKWVQSSYETKNMTGFFQLKPKTASSKAMKLDIFKNGKVRIL